MKRTDDLKNLAMRYNTIFYNKKPVSIDSQEEKKYFKDGAIETMSSKTLDIHNFVTNSVETLWLAIICIRLMKTFGYTKNDFLKHASDALFYHEYSEQVLNYLWDNEDIYFPYSRIKVYGKERHK